MRGVDLSINTAQSRVSPLRYNALQKHIPKAFEQGSDMFGKGLSMEATSNESLHNPMNTPICSLNLNDLILISWLWLMCKWLKL